MCCDGILIREGKKNNSNATYMLASQLPTFIPPQIKGLPPPRRISADSERAMEIMRAIPLRKVTYGIAGASYLMVDA